MSDTVLIGVFTLLGAVIGFLGSMLAAWWQTDRAKTLLDYEYEKKRQLQYEIEDREHKWELQRLEKIGRERPALKLRFDSADEKCVQRGQENAAPPTASQVKFRVKLEQVETAYISINVVNDSGSTAVNCTGELTKLEELTRDEWGEVSIHGPLQLNFAYKKPHVDISNNADSVLNVLFAVDGRDFRAMLTGSHPVTLTESLARKSQYRFTIGVRADGTPATYITLVVKWQPSIAGDWAKENIFVDDPKTEIVLDEQDTF